MATMFAYTHLPKLRNQITRVMSEIYLASTMFYLCLLIIVLANEKSTLLQCLSFEANPYQMVYCDHIFVIK